MAVYDVIVLGTGGIGSAVVSHLACRGARVLGLDQFPPAHDRGSSHGQTRMIRQAYYEHPDYVPLSLRAYELWAALSERRGKQLFFQTGVLQIGAPDGIVVPGVIASARHHGLRIEQLSPADIVGRFPGFAVPESFVGVYEPVAGYLLVEQCVLAHLDDALAAGAALHSDEPVVDIQAAPGELTVQTTLAQYATKRLVITAGPWAGRWLTDLGISLVVRRKPLFWFATRSPVYRATSGCPAYLYEINERTFYGFPEVDPGEIKVAEHTGGTPVADPMTVDREIHPDDVTPIEDFITTCMPDVTRRITNQKVCMYTMSPDAHFIVDRHPADERIAFAAGLSGHGFKFAPVLGEALADLALEGRTSLSIGFLSCRRPELRSP